MPSPRRISKASVMRLVRLWRERLHLHDWKLSVMVSTIPAKDDAKAYCAAKPEYREALVHLDPKEVPPEDLPATLVHELLHCHVEGLAGLALVMAGDDPVRREAVRRAEEELVMRLERVLSEAYRGR